MSVWEEHDRERELAVVNFLLAKDGSHWDCDMIDEATMTISEVSGVLDSSAPENQQLTVEQIAFFLDASLSAVETSVRDAIGTI